MQCTKPIRIFKGLSRLEYPDGLEVPCGKCLGCRIKKRKEWSTRMLHELGSHNKSCFITLTYNNENIPPNASLDKAELQKFFKRLRKNIYPDKIRYFACGEYGDINQRPHYHAIIFGLGLNAMDINNIEISWQKGNIDYGLAEPDSINYVAQYIDKKFTGEKADEEYKFKNREPVFRILSLGLGREYADTHMEQMQHMGHLTVRGIKTSIPRYYINRLGLDLNLIRLKAYEKECDIVSHYSGVDYSRDEAYHILKPDEVRRIEEGIKRSNKQNELNQSAKINLKKSKL
nr:MAG: replication initiator protein [Microvirus sp.]